VAVRLIVEREREIEAFVPEEYWKLTATVRPECSDGPSFDAELKKLDGAKAVVGDEARANVVTEAMRRGAYRVASVETKHKTERPHPPFITSTLQQQASIRLRFTAKKTMMLAQQLYEGVKLGEEGEVGLITYMRTDSVNLADSAIEEARAYIGETFPPEYLPAKPIRYRSKKDAQGAHEAVRPTAAHRTPDSLAPYLTPDQLKLYRLIWLQFVACQMTPARLEMTEIQVEAQVPDPAEGEPGRGEFRATGRRTVFDGYTRLHTSRAREDQELPELAESDPLALVKLDPTQHFTQPPPLYTEATLVKRLERDGIGRPSTYAPIISTIQERGYVERQKSRFHATELGKVVTDLLVPHFGDILDVGFTSQMESRLDEIESQHANWREILGTFYEAFSKDLEKAEANMKDLKREPEVSDEKCEKCGSPMIYKWYRTRKFLACSGYPDCKNTKSLGENGPKEKPVETDHECPKCGEKMLLRKGRRGPFLGCSAYPKCRGTMPVDGGEDGAAGAVHRRHGVPEVPERQAAPGRAEGEGEGAGRSGGPGRRGEGDRGGRVMDEAARKVTEGLQKAIEAEIEGHHFYKMAASSTSDEQGKKVFEALAQEELEHAKFLRSQCASLRETGKVDETAKLGAKADLSGGSPIFSPALKQRIQEAHYEVTALSVGSQLELGAIQFYKAQADAAPDEKVKAFFLELADWESGHYDALTRQLEEMREDYWDAGDFAPF
jgi:DNA topoisomerase I